MAQGKKEHPFQIKFSAKNRVASSLLSPVASAVERAMSLSRLGELYSTVPKHGDTLDFLRASLETLNISYTVSDEEMVRIPKEGRLIVVANHPFGGIEGIILAAVLKTIRPDVKIMANYLLERVPELRDLFLFVDPFGGDVSTKRNVMPIRETMKFLENGGLLGVFPSGTVSHFQWRQRGIIDPEWSQTVARVIKKTESPVLPVYFHGTNGLFFQLMGLLHPRFRTALLPRELAKKANSTFQLTVGSVLPYEKLSSFKDDNDLLSYLRLRTYILKSSAKRTNSGRDRKSFVFFSRPKRLEPIVPPHSASIMADEVAKLPTDQLLIESGDIGVYHARAWQVPTILKEIGRLREITFREASEGTGKSIDLDRFDEYYIHLFAWNKSKHEIVGAYRMGEADRILEQFGKTGLYTSTLFAYDHNLLSQIGPALELGRSFVRAEYQRNYSSLLVLWRGIGRFVVKNPRYKILFGPVSINSDYDSVSRDLIVNFLQANDFMPELARLVKPRNPLRDRPLFRNDPKSMSVVARDFVEVSELVAEIESDQRGIPVLLRQYLKLGGKLLGFNLDPNFGDVLDGLILVDLTQTEARLVERYLGKEGGQSFLAYHRFHGHQKSVADENKKIRKIGRSGLMALVGSKK